MGHGLPAVLNSLVPAMLIVPCTGTVVVSVKSAVLSKAKCDSATVRLVHGLPLHANVNMTLSDPEGMVLRTLTVTKIVPVSPSSYRISFVTTTAENNNRSLGTNQNAKLVIAVGVSQG